MVTDLSLLSQLVSVPFQGEWRFLRFNPEFKEWNYWFPSPLEVNGVSNAEPYQVRTLDLRFPYPREVIGVPNSTKPTDKSKSMIISVLSRGDWGFLLLKEPHHGKIY